MAPNQRISHKTRGRRLLTVFPAVLVSLLPKAACPACWPAYAGLLGAVGINLVDVSPYVFPLTVLLLLIVLGSLGYRARRRRGYGPLALGVLASALIFIGKAALPTADAPLYAGIVLLIGASIWNAWPKQVQGCLSCAGRTERQTRTERRNES